MAVRYSSRLLAIGFLVVVSTACSRSNGSPSATATVKATATAIATPAATPAPSPVASPSPVPNFAATPGVFQSPGADVGKIVWATAIDPTTKAPTQRADVLHADDETIYAAVPVYKVKSGTVFTAKWTYNNTPVDTLTAEVIAPGSYAEAWIEFHITRAADQPWPSGTYEVTVLVGGVKAEHGVVQMRDVT